MAVPYDKVLRSFTRSRKLCAKKQVGPSSFFDKLRTSSDSLRFLYQISFSLRKSLKRMAVPDVARKSEDWWRERDSNPRVQLPRLLLSRQAL